MSGAFMDLPENSVELIDGLLETVSQAIGWCKDFLTLGRDTEFAEPLYGAFDGIRYGIKEFAFAWAGKDPFSYSFRFTRDEGKTYIEFVPKESRSVEDFWIEIPEALFKQLQKLQTPNIEFSHENAQQLVYYFDKIETNLMDFRSDLVLWCKIARPKSSDKFEHSEDFNWVKLIWPDGRTCEAYPIGAQADILKYVMEQHLKGVPYISIASLMVNINRDEQRFDDIFKSRSAILKDILIKDGPPGMVRINLPIAYWKSHKKSAD